MISIDAFHTALGLPLEPLPLAATNVEPNHNRPSGAKPHGAWVPVIQPADFDPAEAGLYNGGRAMDRMQIELLAGRVSSLNECFY